MIEFFKDINVPRIIVAVLVFGGIVFLLAKDGQVDERMFDLAFIICGYFFGAVVAKVNGK